MTFRIDLSPCINCGLCRRACPTGCIHYFTTGHRTHVIDPRGCIDCGICARECPVDCIAHDPLYLHAPLDLEQAREQAREWARERQQQRRLARERAAVAAQRIAAPSAALDAAGRVGC